MSDTLQPMPNAAELGSAAGTPQTCHDPALCPFESEANMLSSLAKEPSQPMDPSVKARQRADILSFASHMPTQSVQAPTPAPNPIAPPPINIPPVASNATPPEKTPFDFKRWFWIGGSVLGAASVVAALVLFVHVSGGPLAVKNLAMRGANEMILIPEAHAGDAFTLFADKSDTAGASVDTDWVLNSQIAVSTDQVRQALTIVPPVEFDVQSSSTNVMKIVPKQPLEAGTVYQVTLAASVAKADGTTEKRPFAWAIQTKNDFRILSTVPGDGSAYVPVDTGIEFKFTRNGWEDPTKFFDIVPATPGRFETHGRTLVFVPNKPLQKGTRYEVMLKAGFGVKGSDLSIVKDIKIRFETATDEPKSVNSFWFATPDVNEFGVGQAMSFDMNVDWQSYANEPINVVGYKLTRDQARQVISDRLKTPEWAVLEKNRFDAFKKAATVEAFRASVPFTRETDYGTYKLALPKQDAPGFFAIKVSSDKIPNSEVWTFVQVTNVAAYVTADKDTVYVWAVNAAGPASLTNLPVTDGTNKVQTDTQGIARMPAPDFLSKTPDQMSNGDDREFRLIEVGTDRDLAFEPLLASSYGYSWRSIWIGDTPGLATTWGYVDIDRPLYRADDTVNFFGIAQDRDSHQGAGSVELRLQNNSMLMDFGTGGDKVYAKATVQTDQAGRFNGSITFANLASGSYKLVLVRDGKAVTTRWFDVKEFVKPSYSITITTDKDRAYSGQDIAGTLKLAFYDGTPMPRTTVRLTSRQSSWTNTQDLTTDDQGVATFALKAQPIQCDPIDMTGWRGNTCQNIDYLSLEARPAAGEEGDISAQSNITVYASNLLLDVKTTYASSTASAAIETHFVDFSKEDAVGNPWPDREIKGYIFGQYWENVQDGTYYDTIEKRVVPRYRYETRYDPVIPFVTRTDASGRVTYAFPVVKNRDYRILLSALDDQGREMRGEWYVYSQGQPSTGTVDQTPHLLFDDGSRDYVNVDPDAQTHATYVHGNQPIQTSKTPGILFLTASRGIKTAEVVQNAVYPFTMTQAYVPNASVVGVTFWNGDFEAVDGLVTANADPKQLTVELKADQEKYAPGGRASVHVIVKNKKTGQRAANVKLALAAMDKSLGALSYLPVETPLETLMAQVPDGILMQQASRAASPEAMGAGGGGAEKGGGGGMNAMNVRRLFKDTAAFQVVDADQNGEADIAFTVPDNLTTWYTQVVALSSDLQAGASQIDLPVTKSVFVDVVLPPRLLTSDKPVLKLRAYGTALQAGTPVAFTVDAPTLGIHNESVTGTSEQPVYVSIGQLVPGTHTVRFSVTSGAGTDALERTLDIADSRYLKDELVTVDAVPGIGLPDIGQPQTDVYLTGKERAQYLWDVRDLVWNEGSARVDAKAASRQMIKLLNSAYGTADVLPDDSLSAQYQDYDGGIRLLPYSSTDLALSSEIAATAPEYFDKNLLASYFWNALDDKRASREVQIEAISGLASLGEPVLTSLQSAAAQTDLLWSEQLVIARGLVASGDKEGARSLLEQLLQKAQNRDNLTWLVVSSNDAENYEATADAAALAASLSHPKAAALRAYIDANWRTDAFPVLARARYLQTVVPLLSDVTASISYSIGGQTEQTVLFKDQPCKVITLTADEAKNFRVTRGIGKVAVSFVRRTPGRPASVPEISISRTMTGDHPADQLLEGDLVRITLQANWQSNAQDGCYMVYDHLPGAFQPIVNWSVNAPDSISYPYDSRDGEVSFVMCKSASSTSMTYLGRVVSRGTYTAEAPSMQNMQFPSVAAVGKDETVTVK